MKDKIVLAYFDLTGKGSEPWAENGYDCYSFDVQHKEKRKVKIGKGSITFLPGLVQDNFKLITALISKGIAFAMAYPPCTHLAVSGAAHFAKKRKVNPDFQHEAMRLFALGENLCQLTEAPYFVENPVSVISTMYRKPDSSFHPWEYGGYLPVNDINPVSDLIPARDAYPKKTCLWTGNNFIMPEKKIVDIPVGYSPQHNKLGGKSQKTKNIRSATPRGFARAVYERNKAQ